MDYEQKHPISQEIYEYLKNTPKEQIDKDWSYILKETNPESYYEQKYKEALNKAQRLSIDGFLDAVAISDIFSELKESEDEKIRKAIIAYISHDQHCGVSNADMIAWLEKQGKEETWYHPLDANARST